MNTREIRKYPNRRLYDTVENCYITLANIRELVVRNLERAEDLSRDSMLAGIKWSWETFPQFLDTVDALPKGINYAGYMGHSALRTYVMGERAFNESANDQDLERMCSLTQEALKAGADEYMMKPFDGDILHSKFAEAGLV